MVQANTTRKYNALAPRFGMPKQNKPSWRLLNQKIVALAKNQVSAKELSEVIEQNNEFAEYLVRQAGCKKAYYIDHATILQAVLLLGMDRICELAMNMA